MSHWAEINQDNVVLRVVVGNNDDPGGDEGYQKIVEKFGGTWVQTSYNGNFKGRFAGVGYRYDSLNDVFIRPQPSPAWIFNESLLDWEPPTPKPEEEGKEFFWNFGMDDWDWYATTLPEVLDS
jgi:hypothetical protein